MGAGSGGVNPMQALSSALSLLGNTNENARSITQSAISGNIQIDTETPENLTALSRDTKNANQRVEKQDLQKVQERQEMAKVIGDISNNAINIATYNEREKINKLGLEKFKLEEQEKALKGQAGNEQQLAAIKQQLTNVQAEITKTQGEIDRTYGIGSEKGMAIRAVTAALQAAAQNDTAGSLVALASPYLNQKIHEMTAGDTAKDKAANLMAHALLSAVEFQVTGKDPLTGAVAGVTGEVTAQILTQAIYNKTPNQLTANEKENISTLSQLAGGLASALTAKANGTTAEQGGSFLAATSGAETAKRAVENNYLSIADVQNFIRELSKAQKEGRDTKPILEKYEGISEENRQQLIACKGNVACETAHLHEMNTGAEELERNLGFFSRMTVYYPNDLNTANRIALSNLVESEYAESFSKLSDTTKFGLNLMEASTAMGFGAAAGYAKVGLSNVKSLISGKNKAYPTSGMDGYKRANVGDEDYTFTYRGDSRDPKEIFKDGFKTRGNSMDLLLHAMDNTSPPSNLVSTSISQGVAINFATNFGMRNGYVYAIKPVGGIDINKKLGSLSPYPSEQEIAIPYGIKPVNILGVTPVDSNGKLGNYSILNR